MCVDVVRNSYRGQSAVCVFVCITVTTSVLVVETCKRLKKEASRSVSHVMKVMTVCLYVLVS